MNKPTDDWPRVLQELKSRLGGKQKDLRAAGMSETNASRAFRQGKSFQVLRCLRLALRTGLSASRILRAAGKAEEAELIERLYGTQPKTQDGPPDPLRERILADWLTFDSEERRVIDAFLTLHESEGERPPQSAASFWDGKERRKQKSSSPVRSMDDSLNQHPEK